MQRATEMLTKSLWSDYKSEQQADTEKKQKKHQSYLHCVTRIVKMVYADKVPKATAANCPPHL